MDDYNDFPSHPTQSFAPQTKGGTGFFESLLSGAGPALAGLFIGAGLYVLWAFTIGHQLGPHTTFGWWSLGLLPAFWWFGTPGALLYFTRWFAVAFGTRHWETPPAVWYSLLNWGSLMWILMLTPRVGFLIIVAIGALALVGRARAAKGGAA